MAYDPLSNPGGYRHRSLDHCVTQSDPILADNTSSMGDNIEAYFSDLAHGISNIALALLLTFAAGRHCRFTFDSDSNGTGMEDEGRPQLGDSVQGGLLAEEIAKVAQSTFGIECKVVNVRECSTSNEAAINMGVSVGKTVLPEMLVVTGLDDAKTEVQGFVAEVMRNRRVELQNGGWIRSGDLFMVVEVAPKTLREHKGISRHLADFFFISYHYTPIPENFDDDGSSFASVVIRKSPSSVSDIQLPSIGLDTIALFRKYAEKVNISTEIKRYMHDLISCIRMHRAVRSGCVCSRATQDFETLVRCLAVIHGLDFVTPALVTLAISKIYNHRLEIIQRPKLERSVLYGSNTGTVGQYLEGLTPEMVVEDAIKSVRVPL